MDISRILKTAAVGLMAVSVLCISSCSEVPEVVEVQDFGLFPDTGADATGPVREALEYCREHNSGKLVFAPGRYDFYPDKTFEKYMFVSNHNDGLKSIAFLIEDMKDFEISAYGAEFVFHGYVSPFVIAESENISLEGFSIDFSRTFQSEGTIVSAGNGILEVTFPEEYPFRIENRRLKFYDPEFKTEYPFGNLLEFDAVRREPAYMVRDYYIGNNLDAELIGDRTVRLKIPEIRGTKGNVMIFAPNHRHVPNIIAHNSENLRFSDITMYNSGGMGLIAQKCRDVTVERMTVTPQDGRVVSCTADATHFSNCAGNILIKDCLFENQMDDATNVHGIYMRIEEIASENTVYVRLVHHEQLGMEIFSDGDEIEFVDEMTMSTIAHGTIKSVKRLNKDITRIVFEENIPESVEVDDVIGATEFPEVELVNTICRNNRARGVLLGSRAGITVDNCFFHIGGSAIMTGGDSRYWFEQGGVTDLTVRNCTFSSCKFGGWGPAVISIDAGSSPEPETAPRFNRNVVIENNTFVTTAPELLYAVSVDGLEFRGNTVTKSEDYPYVQSGKEAFVTERSENIHIEPLN